MNRYEDMVGDPERQARRLCNFVGEDFEPHMLNPEFNNSSSVAWGKRGAAVGITDKSVGRWRGQLTESEAFVAQAVCRSTMKRLGYELETLRPNKLAVAKWFLSTPGYGCRALLAGRHKTGPLLPYLAKRVGPLMQR